MSTMTRGRSMRIMALVRDFRRRDVQTSSPRAPAAADPEWPRCVRVPSAGGPAAFMDASGPAWAQRQPHMARLRSGPVALTPKQRVLLRFAIVLVLAIPLT